MGILVMFWLNKMFRHNTFVSSLPLSLLSPVLSVSLIVSLPLVLLSRSSSNKSPKSNNSLSLPLSLSQSIFLSPTLGLLLLSILVLLLFLYHLVWSGIIVGTYLIFCIYGSSLSAKRVFSSYVLDLLDISLASCSFRVLFWGGELGFNV